MNLDLLSAGTCLALPLAGAAGALILGSGSKAGVYIWRTRKPTAPLGWPVIGRHVAYVGQTKSFAHRERQHLGRPVPSDPYASTGAPWCDLAPRCYRIPLPPWRWLLLLVEALLIGVLLPVYNTKLNRHNPRRISRYRALQMRAARDRAAARPSAMRVTARWVGALRWYHLVFTVIVFSVVVGRVA